MQTSSRFDSLQKGQALLVIVLVMVVVLTIGLSLATRSITNSRVSTEEDNSQKAFSAAEAGVEQLLKAGSTSLPPNTPIGNNTTYTATIQQPSLKNFLLNGGNAVMKDEGADLWLSDYPNYTNQWPAGTFTLFWGVTDSCVTSPPTAAAIEVVVLYNTVSSPKIIHYAFDPCGGATGRRSSNNFSATGAGGSPTGIPLKYSATITTPGPGIIARIIPLYNSTVIGVSSATDMRSQGKEIVSVGKSDTAQRKIIVHQAYPSLPIEMFPYAIFSPN